MLLYRLYKKFTTSSPKKSFPKSYLNQKAGRPSINALLNSVSAVNEELNPYNSDSEYENCASRARNQQLDDLQSSQKPKRCKSSTGRKKETRLTPFKEAQSLQKKEEAIPKARQKNNTYLGFSMRLRDSLVKRSVPKKLDLSLDKKSGSKSPKNIFTSNILSPKDRRIPKQILSPKFSPESLSYTPTGNLEVTMKDIHVEPIFDISISGRNDLPEELAPLTKYTPEPNDEVDKRLSNELKEFFNVCGCLPVPMKRIGSGIYSFGKMKIKMLIVGGNLLVRVGGGFMKLAEFLKNSLPSESAKLRASAVYKEYLLKINGVSKGNDHERMKSPKSMLSPRIKM